MDAKKDHDIKRRRVIALLTREEMEYLDRLGMDALFSTGSKLSRIVIIGALLDAAMALDVSAKGIRNKKELVREILEAARTQPDRRRYPRLKRNLITGFRKMDSMERYKEARTEDIGIGGFRIDVAFLGKPLSVNQVIEITVKDPREKAEPVKAVGRVAWVRKSENEHGYEIGAMLTYIRKEDKARFLKYLSEEVDEQLPH